MEREFSNSSCNLFNIINQENKVNYLLARKMNPNTAGKELEGSLEIVVCDFQGSNSELQVYLHFCWRPHLSHSGLGNKILPTEIKWRLHLQNHQPRHKFPRPNTWGWKIFGLQRKSRTEKENTILISGWGPHRT